jgi:hypothetical protein
LGEAFTLQALSFLSIILMTVTTVPHRVERAKREPNKDCPDVRDAGRALWMASIPTDCCLHKIMHISVLSAVASATYQRHLNFKYLEGTTKSSSSPLLSSRGLSEHFSISQAGLELRNFQHQPPSCLDYKHVPPWPASL